MYCTKCGTELPQDALFCPKCGAEVSTSEQTSSEVLTQKTVEKPSIQSPVQGTNEQVKKISIPKQPFYKKWWFWVLVVWLCLGAIVTTLEDAESENPPDGNTSQEVSLGSDKAHPYVITAEQLANEINRDISAAKAKYNGKWVKITGKISDTSDAGIFGYYIYGKKATSGYTGLKIVCWCDDGPYSGSVLGDTKTFLGQIREITTFNATEIGDCEIVK